MKNRSNQNINNAIRYAMKNSSLSYYELKQNYMRTYSTQDKIRLIVVLWGQIYYTFNEKNITQTNTELILLPPYSKLHIHVIKPTKLMVLEITDDLIKSVYDNVEQVQSFNDSVNNPKLYVSIKYDNVLYKSIQSIHSEYAENSKNPYLVELNINRLIYNLLNTKYAGYLFSVKAKHPMEQVKYYIDRNIKNNIKISDLAELAGMNSSNFSNTFKRYFNLTPINYISDSKIRLAEELLKDKSVTEVAFELGFENVSSFISQFKKVHKVTPKQFQILNL